LDNLEFREVLGQRDLAEIQALKAIQAHKDSRVQQVLLEVLVLMEILDLLGTLVTQDHLVLKEV